MVRLVGRTVGSVGRLVGWLVGRALFPFQQYQFIVWLCFQNISFFRFRPYLKSDLNWLWVFQRGPNALRSVYFVMSLRVLCMHIGRDVTTKIASSQHQTD